MTDISNFETDLALIQAAAEEAARIAMRYFRKDPKVSWKQGVSPVTEADLAVDAFLQQTLLKARPGYGWLSEETADVRAPQPRQRTFVVDPIDGTRAFIDGKDVWCVSVAVIEDNMPIAGVLNCPARGETYMAARGQGATLNEGRLMPAARPEIVRLAAAKSAMSNLSANWPFSTHIIAHVPSLAYRIAMIAAGQLDGTVIKPNSHDWDLAAADLILSETGGRLSRLDGQHPLFGKADPGHPMLLAGSAAVFDQMLSVVQQDAPI